MNNHMDHRLINIAALFVIITLTVNFLVLSKSLLLPFLCAVVIWYITIRLAESYSVLPFLHWPIPQFIALALALITTIIVIYYFFVILAISINSLLLDAVKYQQKIQFLGHWISTHSYGKINLQNIVSNFNFSSIMSNVAFSLTSLAGNITFIIIYVLFLLIEYKSFPRKILAVCGTTEHYQQINEVLLRIKHDIDKYLKIKTIISILTGLLSYSLLLSFHVKHAEFWGLVFFLLNYIPTIGPIIAVIFTLLAISIQFDSIWLLSILALLLSAIQFIMGNILETRYMGRYLNLSPLVILLALAFWGYIWGVIGMILCIPLMNIINIILANFQRTRWISILLSAN